MLRGCDAFQAADEQMKQYQIVAAQTYRLGVQGRIYHRENEAAAPGPHQFHKIRGPHHKDNEIDLFRVVDFFNVTITVNQSQR